MALWVLRGLLGLKVEGAKGFEGFKYLMVSEGSKMSKGS